MSLPVCLWRCRQKYVTQHSRQMTVAEDPTSPEVLKEPDLIIFMSSKYFLLKFSVVWLLLWNLEEQNLKIRLAVLSRYHHFSESLCLKVCFHSIKMAVWASFDCPFPQTDHVPSSSMWTDCYNGELWWTFKNVWCRCRTLRIRWSPNLIGSYSVTLHFITFYWWTTWRLICSQQLNS